MPTKQTVDAFIARVVSGAHEAAIEEFYTADATMQENLGPPRRGRASLLAHERAFQARSRSVTTTCVPPVLIAGEHVIVRWVFEFTWQDGSASRLEELAWQRWEGERIAQETFFYDPAQLASCSPAASALTAARALHGDPW
jgi:hypothetical protein